MELIAKCVNFTNMGTYSEFSSQSGGRHPYLIINEALNYTNGGIQFQGSALVTTGINNQSSVLPCMPTAMYKFSMVDAEFDCDYLPICLSTCGVSARSISPLAYSAGCKTEYMVHSFIARFWITMLVFVCLNISRVLFMSGIVRLGWRSLTPRGFEFISNCTRVGETSKTINAQLVVQLNKAIASYERFAIFLFGMAVLIHIPYIVVLATINQNIEFKGS